MQTQINKNLSTIFKDISSIYQYIGGEERFRSLAYKKAAKVMDALTNDVTEYVKNKTLKELPGIGESISGKIEEFVKTGKIKKYEQLKRSVPHELIEMMEITGFGSRSLKRIHEGLKISTKEELIRALQNGKLLKLKGFGRKKIESMLRGLKLHKTVEERMLLWDALETGNQLIAWMKNCPEVKQIELAGSLRRKKETVGDIDLLISSKEKDRNKIIARFTSMEISKEVLVKGETKASIILKDTGRQADLRIVNEDEWGAALQYFTGSKEHNVHLRTIAKDKGLKISEHGLFHLKSNRQMAGRTEEEVYHQLGYQYIPPEMREDNGEIELAVKNKIPELVSLHDIKGDLQMHSVWSDGLHSIEDIVKYVRKNFPYEYIAITDHSKSSRVAHGMNEDQILRQIKAIEGINKKLGEDFVKAGIEVDILPDGSLDISDEILSQLEWVTASIHSGFNHDNTDRIICACENPYVHCIGHPCGRLIGSREPYKIELEKIIEAAKETNTFLEINAQPERMDLKDEHAMQARIKGTGLVISTDSHTLDNFNFMKLGVDIAKRAWCTKDDIVNALSWNQLSGLKNKKLKHAHAAVI